MAQRETDPMVEMKIKMPASFREKWNEFCEKNGVNRHSQAWEALKNMMDTVQKHGWAKG